MVLRGVELGEVAPSMNQLQGEHSDNPVDLGVPYVETKPGIPNSLEEKW